MPWLELPYPWPRRSLPRRAGFIARFGGEEFTVILAGREPADQAGQSTNRPGTALHPVAQFHYIALRIVQVDRIAITLGSVAALERSRLDPV